MTKKLVSALCGSLCGLVLVLSGCPTDIGGEDMAVPDDLAMPPPADMAAALTQKGSCDLRKYSPATQECRDYESSGTQFITTFKGTCTTTTAWTDALCNHTGALGGCRTPYQAGGGGVLTQWYFAQAGIMTQADVQAKCAATSASTTFVAP